MSFDERMLLKYNKCVLLKPVVTQNFIRDENNVD